MPAPTYAISSPPSIGPTARATLNWVEFRVIAFWRWRAGHELGDDRLPGGRVEGEHDAARERDAEEGPVVGVAGHPDGPEHERLDHEQASA